MLTEELSKFAEAWYVSASQADRAEIDRIVADLCADPAIDNTSVFALPRMPVILRLYQDEQYFIVFSTNGTALLIMGIGKAGDEITFGQKGRPPSR